MRSKRGIIFASVVITILVIVIALLINHIICQDGEANETLMTIDNKAVELFNTVTSNLKSGLSYVKYVYQKVVSIQTQEYPEDQLPLYKGSKILDYTFDDNTNSLNISVGTNDSFEAITAQYQATFFDKIEVDYFKEFNNPQHYTAYGMIGNFTFLLEVIPSEHRKYDYEINTQLNYLKGDSLQRENFFRQNVGSSSYLYANPYIYIYMMPNDKDNIYLQLKDYKSQLLNIVTHVELYIDGDFYSSRYYGDTIVLPTSTLNQLHTVRMIAFDDNNCIWAIDEMQNALCYDASGQSDLYNLASYYSNAQNLFIYNTENLDSIGYLKYFTNLESLYLQGNNHIDDYTTIFSMPALSELYLDRVDNIKTEHLNQIKSLNVLKLSNISSDINLGVDFANLQCSELIIENCPNITFDEYGLFSMSLERLAINYNYSLQSIGFISVYPQLHMLELSNCDRLSTVLNTINLPNLNILSVNNCSSFDLSQPLDNMNSLMSVDFENNNSLAAHSAEYVQSVWSNSQLISYSVESCANIANISYNNEVWKAGK